MLILTFLCNIVHITDSSDFNYFKQEFYFNLFFPKRQFSDVFGKEKLKIKFKKHDPSFRPSHCFLCPKQVHFYERNNSSDKVARCGRSQIKRFDLRIRESCHV